MKMELDGLLEVLYGKFCFVLRDDTLAKDVLQESYLLEI